MNSITVVTDSKYIFDWVKENLSLASVSKPEVTLCSSGDFAAKKNPFDTETILVESSHFFNLKACDLFGENVSIYLVISSSDDMSNEIERECSTNPDIEGVIDLTSSKSIIVPLFRSLLRRDKDREIYSELNKIKKGLNRITSSTLLELHRVKNIHDKIVPLRKEKMKGVELLSKYLAGERSGGDFFDLIKGKNDFLLLMTSSKSYMVTSVILSHFEHFKSANQTSINIGKSLTKSIAGELKEMDLPRTENDLELFVMSFNLLNMTAECVMFGNFELVTSGNNSQMGNNYPVDLAFWDKACFKISFIRDEQLVILFPGIKRNVSDMLDGVSFNEYLKNRFDKSGKTILNELFYNIQKSNKDEFLQYDASAIYLEVDENVIMQV